MPVVVDGVALVDKLDERGWVQGTTEDDAGRLSIIGALRTVLASEGRLADAYLVEQIAEQDGWGDGFNDRGDTTIERIRQEIGKEIVIDDSALEAIYGPQHPAVAALLQQVLDLDTETLEELHKGLTRDDEWRLAREAAWQAGMRLPAWWATWAAARHGQRTVRRTKPRWDRRWDAAWDACAAVTTWHLTGQRGGYSQAHRDRLIGPWSTIVGTPAGLPSGDDGGVVRG